MTIGRLEPGEFNIFVSMRTYLRVLGYLRPHAGLLGLSFLLMILFALVDGFSIVLLIPFLQVLFGGPQSAIPPAPEGFMGQAEHFVRYDLFAWLQEGSALDTLRNVCLIILAIYFLKAILGYLQDFLPQIVLERALRDLRAEFFARLQRLSFRYFQQLDGSVMLPAGFTPQRVRITLRGENASVNETLGWKSGTTVTGET